MCRSKQNSCCIVKFQFVQGARANYGLFWLHATDHLSSAIGKAVISLVPKIIFWRRPLSLRRLDISAFPHLLTLARRFTPSPASCQPLNFSSKRLKRLFEVADVHG